MHDKFSISSLLLILAISLCYSFIVGAGYYGFSNDFYGEYYKNNLIYSSFREAAGSLLSTLTVFNTHIGVELTSFFLALSAGLLIRSVFISINKYSINIFLLIFLITLHAHPIIMSTSGAMRQGWVMSFFYIGLSIIILNNKILLSFLFFFLLIFFHKSGLIFFLLCFFTIFILRLKKKIDLKRLDLIFIGTLLFLLSCFYLKMFGWTVVEHRIVYGDFRWPWLFCNFLYVATFLNYLGKKHKKKLEFPSLLLYFFSCLAPSFFFMGLNWQYERINMVAGIFYVIIFVTFFKKRYFYSYLITLLLLYLFLTIYQGMYTIGLT